MEQTNAFELLGATPSDTIETLQELLDEKELLSDDVAAVQSAYADLTNPKKRLIHEISYLRAKDFAEFKKLVFHEYVEFPSIKEVAQILVNMGLWFDSDNDELFDDINASREESGFVTIEDDTTIIKAVNDLRNDCLQAANNYLDNLKETSLVGVFNQIVKIGEYKSFFVDELIAHYELIISESLQKKENECRDSFESIEKSCSSFNNGSPLSPYLKTQISEFEKKLKSWDNYAQPLQVNMQRHGGQHEASERLVCDIRNKMIDLCNRSQESLSKMLDVLTRISNLGSGYMGLYDIREKLPQKLLDSVVFLDDLILLTDILTSAFAEVEFTAEQLKKDKTALLDLRKTISSLNDQVQEAKKQASQRAYTPSYRTSSGGCYIATCVYGSYDCPEVWTLRRYRDKTLGSSWYGRLFIRLYYAISPTVIKIFGKTKWFQSLWKKVLDKKVQRLHKKGFEDTPYADIDWRQK